MQTDKVLLVPYKADVERDKIFDAWKKLGGRVQRIDKFWERPANLQNQKVAIYGNDTFALVLAQVLDVQLISPDDLIIARLDKKWTKRSVVQKKIREVTENDLPGFIKPSVPKQFKAGIYHHLKELLEETNGISSEEILLLSEIVDVKAEARGFVLEGALKDLALYEGSVDLETGKEFLNAFLKNENGKFPKTFVVDIGFNHELGWYIIEFNSSWGAGLNNCQPEKVIECIVEATEKN
ncbi:MAG TPA: ATP-grasp domain-containing protein [Chitinophagales bacterium]|nr:ATP-grasp domain-containing protein [Chitinophagales bacterium]